MIELKTKCRNCEHPVSLQMMEFGDPLPPEAAADESMRDALKSWIWTTESPTIEGWYWYFGGGEDEPHPEYVYFDKEQNGLCINILGYSLRVDENKRYWLGPLPVPEPPKE